MKKDLLSLSVSINSFDGFVHNIIKAAQLRQSRYSCLANVHMLVESCNNASFASAVNKADIVAPDGVPLLWALKLLHGVKQERIAGMDLLPALLSQAEENEIPVFFYGGTGEM